MPTQGLSLVGFMDQQPAIDYLATICIPSHPSLPRATWLASSSAWLHPSPKWFVSTDGAISEMVFIVLMDCCREISNNFRACTGRSRTSRKSQKDHQLPSVKPYWSLLTRRHWG